MITAAVILAAGGSARLGRPKQQLLYKGKTLLENAVQAAIDSVCRPIIVVLNTGSSNLIPAIAGAEVYIIQNENWQEGIGTSIQCGIKELQKISPPVTDAVIMLCDQPYADSGLLNELIKKRIESGKEIIASEYNNTLGVPALYNHTFFPLLQQLKGKEGAKKIILSNDTSVASVPFPLGDVDIDTHEDYEHLINLE